MKRNLIIAILVVFACSSVFLLSSCAKKQVVAEEKEITAPSKEAAKVEEEKRAAVEVAKKVREEEEKKEFKKAEEARVEGNCDERGTNEYNLALGERRAENAKNFLLSLGISPDRIETISYGEERPLAAGHNEDSWAQNRRDDFVIMKK